MHTRYLDLRYLTPNLICLLHTVCKMQISSKFSEEESEKNENKEIDTEKWNMSQDAVCSYVAYILESMWFIKFFIHTKKKFLKLIFNMAKSLFVSKNRV